MEKIKNLFKSLFSVDSFLTGLMYLGLGLLIYHTLNYIITNPFGFLRIFIWSIGVILCIFFLGYLLNNRIKDDN
jgi:hypothetical protein